MIILDYKDRRPIYEQIIARFKDLISDGVLTPDEQLPSVRQLALSLSINPNTIQRAFGELEKTGVIYSVKGKGNFVSLSREKIRKEKEESLFAEIRGLAIRAAALGVMCEGLIGEFKESYKKAAEGQRDD